MPILQSSLAAPGGIPLLTGSYSNPTWIASLSETKVLPSQTGNTGRYLTTDGNSTSWTSGLTSGSSANGFIQYSGLAAVSGQINGGSTTPANTVRLNYEGNFYATSFNAVGTADTATAASHYFVETATDGFIRPKTLANAQAEIVTAATVYSVGVTSGTATQSFVAYNSTTATAGRFDGGTTTPTGTNRLNFGGYIYPTALNLVGTADTATAATHYFVENASDGFIRPKTQASTQAEIVTAATVYSVGVTSGTATQSFVAYNSTTATAGRFDGGAVAPTGTTRLNYGGNFYANTFFATERVKISTIADVVTSTATTTSTTATALISFPAASYGSAKVFIQATQGVNRQVTELLVVHDGTTASATEYGTQFTGGARLFNTEVDINTGNLRVLVSTVLATSTVYKTQYTLLTA